MPGFQPYHLTKFFRGVSLLGLPDAILPETFRRALNVRTDITAGAITTRPGWRRRTDPAETHAEITYLSKLYGAAQDWGYAQMGQTVFRYTFTSERPGVWDLPTAVLDAGADVVSDANYVDGKGGIWKFLVNGEQALMDNGTDNWHMGIDPPKAPPSSATLGLDRMTQISGMNSAGDWAGTDLVSGPATDSTIKQVGAASVTFQVAKAVLGSIMQANVIDLDMVPFGDESVKVDDYIHLWVRIDRPEWLEYMQLDFDLSGTEFAQNYYSVRIAPLARLNQGRDVWTQLQVRKSEFSKFGDDTLDWRHVKGIRLSFLATNSPDMPDEDAITVHLDDFKLRGGVGIEGEITYTITYRMSDTGARGNPPITAGGEVRYTQKLLVDRRTVVLNLTNVAEGGAAHPGQSKIDTIQIWRRGGAFAQAVLVAEVPDTTTTYTDDTADSTLVAAGFLSLEVDNHRPPTGTTRVLFGPDANGYLFMLVDGHKLYFSKPFEADESRAENWPAEQYMLIGDGSLRAVGGICTDTQTFVGTQSQTYEVMGQGADTFLPVAIPNSHEWVGRWAVTSGAGSVFFVANDGIYEMRGLQQTKLTDAIDPFFHGRAISGQAGLSRSPAVRALIRLQYYPDPESDTLVMTYSSSFLVLKRNAETGTFTECYFGSSALTRIRALYVDPEANLIFGGGGDGNIYQIEDVTAENDAGTAIPILVRTASLNFNLMQQKKKVASVHIEGNTVNAPFNVTAFYDRETLNEDLGIFQTTTVTSVDFFTPADPEARRSDLAIQIEGEALRRITIVRFSCTVALAPELYTFLDSDVLILDNIHHAKYLEFELQHPAPITVTLAVDGVTKDVRTLLLQPITVRQRVMRHFIPAGIKGYIYRVSLRSTQPFELYGARLFLKGIGNDLTSGFKPLPLIFPALSQGGQ